MNSISRRFRKFAAVEFEIVPTLLPYRSFTEFTLPVIASTVMTDVMRAVKTDTMNSDETTRTTPRRRPKGVRGILSSKPPFTTRFSAHQNEETRLRSACGRNRVGRGAQSSTSACHRPAGWRMPGNSDEQLCGEKRMQKRRLPLGFRWHHDLQTRLKDRLGEVHLRFPQSSDRDIGNCKIRRSIPHRVQHFRE